MAYGGSIHLRGKSSVNGLVHTKFFLSRLCVLIILVYKNISRKRKSVVPSSIKEHVSPFILHWWHGTVGKYSRSIGGVDWKGEGLGPCPVPFHCIRNNHSGSCFFFQNKRTLIELPHMLFQQIEELHKTQTEFVWWNPHHCFAIMFLLTWFAVNVVKEICLM